MLVLNSPQVVQETCLRWKREHKLALVPTMGCLHNGHLELVRTARDLAEKVIVSIFVNPLQFGPNEDFEKYPRSFEEDCRQLEAEGVDLVFHPSVGDLYLPEFSTRVALGDLSTRLCGEFRPGHFEGVATVCLKLFNVTQADYAIFGEKDFQQLRIIQQITGDLNLPITIVPHRTVREKDGLALSSRNTYLSVQERAWAAAIPQVLTTVRDKALASPSITVRELQQFAEENLSKAQLRVQYATVTTSRQLKIADGNASISSLSFPHFLVAVYAGSTRLIDNVSLNGDHG